MREPYASVENVRSHLSFVPTFTATSKPNATQVYSHLSLASDELDTYLSLADYSLPVPTSASQARDTLRSYAAVGAAYYTALSMPQGRDGLHVAPLERHWDVILNRIRQDEANLPDLPRDAGVTGVRFNQGLASAIFVATPLDY